VTTSLFTDAPSSRENLNRAIAYTAPHLRPVLEAVRDFRVGMLFVRQTAEPFRIHYDLKRPAIVMIGDDFDRAVGPAGFHLPSVRRAIRACSAFAVVSSAPPPDAYAAIAHTAAITRRNTMLIETRVDQEIAWVALIQKLAPGRFVLLSTVKGGHA
jgi:hypothetical protein